MAYYLLQASYTPESWEALIKDPQGHFDAVRPVVGNLGGSIQGS